LQVPLAIFVWDDGYGISVPKKYQTTKGSISEVLSGFQKEAGTNGINIYNVKGWDYASMCEAFEEGIRLARENHTPVLFHVEELTQPQGHSTSGSHERYKSAERLQWERAWDGLVKMREWILANMLADEEELEAIEIKAKESVRASKNKAWQAYLNPIKNEVAGAVEQINETAAQLPEKSAALQSISKELSSIKEPLRRDMMHYVYRAINVAGKEAPAQKLNDYYQQLKKQNGSLYNTHLYNEGPKSALRIAEVKPQYAPDAPNVNGYEILNKYFNQLFAHNPKVVAFGEDLGYIGDVNQGFAGLQAKYGASRILDTGIRENTIIGQGIGLALRGLRPIAEIQYIDYLLYGLQPLSDDAATVHYRSNGQQNCPIIVRTRGHRLEGIWHSGSPMGMIINALRGLYVCVPRNMVQAVGMYNTLLQSNDPALMVEC